VRTTKRIVEVEVPKPEQVLSFSSIKDWKTCRKAWHYKRVLKLSPRRKPVALRKGSAVHELLETYLTGNSWRDKLAEIDKEYRGLSEEDQEFYGNLPGDCERIVQGWIDHWKDNPVETLGVEINFGGKDSVIPALEIIPGVFLQGKIDWVFKDTVARTGIWVCDHKTYGKSIPDESQRLNDLQTIIYSEAMPMLGFPRPTGVVFDYLKTKLPEPPKILRDGSLTKSSKVGCSHEQFMEAIQANGLNPDDYQTQLELAKANVFYDRKYIAKPKTLARTLIEELRIVNHEIKYLKDFPYRNYTFNCKGCSFLSLCTAELNGLDTQFLLDTEYETREELPKEDPNGESEGD
jgi:hypothetical protein